MFGNNRKKIRKKRAPSQEALSEKLNVDRQTILKWENGLSVSNGNLLIKISQVLEISVETF
ncbi:MAG: helix-turn-helix transcriptional regulator [Oscillibacter sp.]|nr:helix-turn-helix transcriptional regulator [Oscillibacter sp.]